MVPYRVFHDEPVPLWVLQDDDPQYLRYVTDEASNDHSRRLVDLNANMAFDAGLEAWIAQVLAAGEECQGCEFLKTAAAISNGRHAITTAPGEGACLAICGMPPPNCAAIWMWDRLARTSRQRFAGGRGFRRLGGRLV